MRGERKGLKRAEKHVHRADPPRRMPQGRGRSVHRDTYAVVWQWRCWVSYGLASGKDKLAASLILMLESRVAKRELRYDYSS